MKISTDLINKNEALSNRIQALEDKGVTRLGALKAEWRKRKAAINIACWLGL